MTIGDKLTIGSSNVPTDSLGHLTFNNYRVNPFFYTLKDIPWDLFWTNHFKGCDYNRDDESAERNRKILIASVIRQSKEHLGLYSRDIQYFGVTEKRSERCHTHTLIHVKRKAGQIVDTLMQTVQKFIPWDVVTIPEIATKEKANQIVNDPIAVAAYISKLNKNEMELPSFHHSLGFINFVTNHRAYGV